MTVFIRGAPLQDNILSECIRTVAAMYGSKMLRLIHMQPSTDTNTTSDQWSYLHKNIIFLVSVLILRHLLSRLIQKYLSPVINCLLSCMNWYSWGVIRKSHRIHSRSHRIRVAVKFYNHTLRVWYGCVPIRYYPPMVLFLNGNSHEK